MAIVLNRAPILDRLEAHRDHHFRRMRSRRITNEKAALSFINEVGFCAAFTAGLGVPCLREAIVGQREPVLPEHIQHDHAIGMTWRLKDDFAARRAAYYGKAIGGRPGFIARDLLGAFLRLRVAPGGYRKLYVRGMLSQCAKLVMDALTKRGAAETRALKLTSGYSQPKHRAAFDRAMKELQEKFLALKVEERYEPFTYVWDTMEHRWADAIREARALAPREAAYRIVRRYFEIAAYANEKTIARLLTIPPDLVTSSTRRLEREGLVKRGHKLPNYPGQLTLLTQLHRIERVALSTSGAVVPTASFRRSVIPNGERNPVSVALPRCFASSRSNHNHRGITVMSHEGTKTQSRDQRSTSATYPCSTLVPLCPGGKSPNPRNQRNPRISVSPPFSYDGIMPRPNTIRVHLIAGGFPAGSPAGHDMNYARLRLLAILQENPALYVTVSNDYTDLARWLPDSRLLITYVAGPFPDDAQNAMLRQWIEAGGRWLALHGTSGGKAARVGEHRRQMVKGPYHDTLGSFFLNHPPVRKFRVDVTDVDDPITKGLPGEFEVADELYLIELQHPETTKILLTTELPTDPSPRGFGFAYERDTSLLPDGKTRVLGYTHPIGKGAVTYIALGHCHNPTNNVQPFVDATVDPTGKTPLTFRGSWETPQFDKLLHNAVEWGAMVE
jgi:type 1 glutamine amidotransferase